MCPDTNPTSRLDRLLMRMRHDPHLGITVMSALFGAAAAFGLGLWLPSWAILVSGILCLAGAMSMARLRGL